MNLLKKITISVATLSLVSGFYAVPAFAAADAVNTGISNNSYADVEATDIDTVSVDSANTNQAAVNVDAALANTGLNFQSDGEDGNGMTTAGAQAGYKTDNFMNVNEASGQDGAVATNTNISDHSDGDATATDDDTVTVDNANTNTALLNLTASIANTGFNFQNDNEDGNDMTTGWAVSGAVTSNVVNHNVVSGSCGEPQCGAGDPTAVATNSNISNHSFADSEATDQDTVTVTNNNTNTVVGNVTTAVSTSGLNFQTGNEDDNTITTGNTSAGAMASNYVNVNTTTVGEGGAVATNTNISDHSDGDATADDSDTVTVTNNNTNTVVGNVTAAGANSGGNVQVGNEDGNHMTTGSAVASGTTTNVVNANQVSW